MPNLTQYQIAPPPTKAQYEAKIGNTSMGTSATTITGAIAELKDKVTIKQPTGWTRTTTGWNTNYTSVYKINTLVIINVYVQGTPEMNKYVATGLPKPTSVMVTAMGTPASVFTLTTNGDLYISSPGTGIYIGGTIAYVTSS